MREMGEETKKESRVEKFNGTDFRFQRMQIDYYFYGKKLHELLLGELPEDMDDHNWES